MQLFEWYQKRLDQATAESEARDRHTKRMIGLGKALGFIGMMILLAGASAVLGQKYDTSGALYALMHGKATTAQPTYSNNATSALSLSARGGLRSESAWPFTQEPNWRAISGGDSLRCKVWNSAGCSAATQVGDCEEYKGLLRLKFRRKSDPGTEVVVSKVITEDNDRSAAGFASGGSSWPFGASASRGRTVTDADSPGTSCAITSIIAATQVVTSCAHGFTTNSQMVLNLTGTNSTPSADGLHQVTITGATTYTIDDLDITGDGGAAGSHYGSRTLTSATASFTANDIGKNITLSTGGVVCTTSDVPCQGPKFPIGTLYQGTIVGFTNSTTVTVLPTIHVDPAGSATLKIEPVLLGDDDATELGDGWLTGADLNFWDSEILTLGTSRQAIKVGQTYYECEINKNPGAPGSTFNMHDGFSLWSDYQETSYHLTWSGGQVIKRHKYGDTAGWVHEVTVTNPSAGADWTYTVPTNSHQKILAVRAILTASATAANRIASVAIDDGTSNLTIVPVPLAAQTASQTTTYNWAPGIGYRTQTPLSGNIQSFLEFPANISLTEAGRVRTSTSGIQAGDQWSAIIVTVEEWIEE